MSEVTASRPALVALVGNPNAGKTSVFNALTGARHRVGNYPGVTVQRVTGKLVGSRRAIELVDLPGTYSLAAHSPDEAIVVDVLLGRQASVPRPDAVVVVVDATNLQRNLFLVTQVLDLGLPTVVALNMADVAERRGLSIDTGELGRRLGVPVVPTVGRLAGGCAPLVGAIESVLDGPAPAPCCGWPETINLAVLPLLAVNGAVTADATARYLMLRCLLDEDGYLEQRQIDVAAEGFAEVLAAQRSVLRSAGLKPSSAEAEQRYPWIETTVDAAVRRVGDGTRRSDQIDQFVGHPLAGSILLIVIMGGLFLSVFSWAVPLMDAIEAVLGYGAAVVRTWLPAGVLSSFLADGVIAGVGGVLVFLPQIVILTGLIAMLEDSGYLARAAFLLDRLLRTCGLGGKSFVPLLASMACAIPGMLATRTIEDRRSRLLTLLVAPFMTCSARIPVYTLMIAAFVPRTMLGGIVPLQGLVFIALYLVGIVAAAGSAALLGRTVLRGVDAPFLLELPSYKWPSLRTISLRMVDAGREFVVTAGTIILASSVLIWALLYFPRSAAVGEQVRAVCVERGVTDEKQIDDTVESAYLRESILGRIGRRIEPVFKPLGWDWRVTTAVMAAFPAREVVISTMGILYNLGGDVDIEDTALRERLRRVRWPDGALVFSPAVAFSLVIFFALCCQCQATLAVMWRETGSAWWPIGAFVYMSGLAYAAAWVVYRLGSWWGG